MISALGRYKAFVLLEGQRDEIDDFWKRGMSRLVPWSWDQGVITSRVFAEKEIVCSMRLLSIEASVSKGVRMKESLYVYWVVQPERSYSSTQRAQKCFQPLIPLNRHLNTKLMTLRIPRNPTKPLSFSRALPDTPPSGTTRCQRYPITTG